MGATLVFAALVFLAVYGAVGLVFALAFQLSGAMARLDPSVRGSSPAFRVLATPGLVALWPRMLVAWARAGRNA